MGEQLIRLALQLEDSVSAPVDIEHVLAAIVLAARGGEISAETSLNEHDPALQQVLRRYLTIVFERYGGRLGQDDP